MVLDNFTLLYGTEGGDDRICR